ncbi:two-component regulator propeller domain-containing protein [Agriterribacter sp.]|uniref:two-component regulator propeller domain-containing protein n=1 Tax=Agriterribacter sp. TaxID=2821509 RepID=UPI002C9E89D2|nr:two-component regulator propeller domain-containing protein [Agriterribacter sp.]HTN08307.1 two-component regulator propeller domain-containing protein [Agriterribacter sp.]
MKQTFALIFTLQLCAWGACQNTIGLPDIINYSKQVYKAGTQNWDICQDVNGLLYFANNEGLLSFDGNYWNIYPLPNKTIVRSIAIGTDNNIYTGGQDEIGYFSPDRAGTLTYHSLKNIIPEQNRSFADVWDIICRGKQVFFRSNKQIFQLSDSSITVYPSANWLFMGATTDLFIAQDFQTGILKFGKDVWTPVADKATLPPGFLVTAVLPAGKDSTFITSLKHGIYLYTKNRLTPVASPALKKIAEYNIYSATAIDKTHYALATTTKGCIIIDKKGSIIQQFSTLEGLQNNNVLSIFPDKHKNLWLGLDHGIDFIAYNSAIKHIFPDIYSGGAGYSSIIHNKHLYIATTNGLYQAALNENEDLSFVKGSFKLVENTRGQVWNLSEVNGKLLVGHHEGFREVNGNKTIIHDNSTGFWAFLPFYSTLPSPVMIAGTYYGIRFYNYQNGQFSKAHIDADFESARFVAVSGNSVWVSHPYKGIYRVQLQPSGEPLVKAYGKKQGLGLTTNGNYIFKVKNRVVATTEKGIYEYNEQSDTFEPSAYFEPIFGQTIVRYLKEDPSGNIWFVFDKNIGVVDYSAGTPRIIYISELNRKLVSGFEQVYPADEHNIFVGSEKGYFHINYAKYKRNHPALQVQLRKAIAIGPTDSLLFNGYFKKVNEAQQQHITPVVSYKWNSFHFEFSSPLYEQQSNIEYSCLLKGYDNKWSEWSNKTEKEYVYLPAGTYHFEVKARNNLRDQSAVYMYSFVILSPWYQAWWAYILYTCVLAYGLYMIYIRQKQKFIRQQQRYEERQKQLRSLHQLELEKNDKEIMRLRNEKLEAEIHHKNKEMASATMHLVKKGELMTRIKDELTRLTKNTEEEQLLDILKKMIKTLGEEDKADEVWDQFTVHFDKAHNDFFVALKQKHSNLTPNELKLCAYLRMNLSTKEMAQLMNISIRGVEISRYRLRKKLQIPGEMNLFTYLLDFHSNGEANKET